MQPTTLECIKQQYDPVWQALQPGVIDVYRQKIAEFSTRLDYFSQLLQLAPPPQHILELACGSGVASVELARQGYRVTGLDCSEPALQVAESLARHVEVEVEWLLGDMRDFKLDKPVDYILLWDVVFGIFADPGEDARVLERISSSLKAGGRCLLQIYGKPFALEQGIEDRYFYDRGQDLFVLDQARFDLPVKKIKLYSLQEWEVMFGRVDMKVIRVDNRRLETDPVQGPSRLCHLVAEK